jgi:hypothetical protein
MLAVKVVFFPVFTMYVRFNYCWVHALYWGKRMNAELSAKAFISLTTDFLVEDFRIE